MQPPLQDFHYAFRQLRKHPAFATVACPRDSRWTTS